MKKAIAAVLCALMISGCAAAQAEEDPAGTGIRIRNGSVQILNEDNEWESIGSVNALENALQEYDGNSRATTDASTDQTAEAEETAEASASASVKSEETSSPFAESTASAETSLQFTTGKNGELYLNGEATGYRLVKEEKAESTVSASIEPAPSASASEEDKSEYLNLETKEDGGLYLDGTYTGYKLEKISDELNDVNITFITSDGEEVGTQELQLSEGTYTGKIEAPEGYELSADDNTLVVSKGNNERIVIVGKQSSDESKDSGKNTYHVTIHFKDTDNNSVEDEELSLTPGTYTTDITDYKGKDHTIVAPEGYICLKPEEVNISDDTELDIIVKEGARCGSYAHWGPSSNACVCDVGYSGDPYEEACTKNKS